MPLRMSSVFLILCFFLLHNGTASADKRWYVYQNANTIYSMAVSGSVVWCATSGGLIRLHPDKGEIKRLNEMNKPSTLNFTKLKTTPDGKLWGLSNGVLFWIDSAVVAAREVLTMSDFHEVGGDGAPPRGRVTDFDTGPDNALWAGTDSGLYHLSGNAWERTDFEYNRITSVVIDGLGRIWAGGYKSIPLSEYEDVPHGYLAIYLNNGTGWTEFANLGEHYPDLTLYAWKEDKIFARRPKEEAYKPDYFYYIHGTQMELISERADFPPRSTITTFNAGPDGSAWLGTSEGIWHLTFDSNISFKKYTLTDGLPDDTIFSIVSTRDGKLIAGTDGGFGIYNRNKWSPLRVDGPVGHKIRQSMKTPDGDMWFGSEKGISRFHNGAWKTYTMADGLAGNSIDYLWIDSRGRIWYASFANWGVGYFENEKWTSFTGYRDWYSPIVVDDVITWVGIDEKQRWFDNRGPAQIRKSPDGSVWVLKNTNDLYRYIGKDGTKIASFGSRTITDFKVAPDSSVWICSAVYFKKYKNGVWTEYPYNEKSHYPSMSVIITPQNEIWCNTGWGGLGRLEGDTFQPFPFPEGISNNLASAFYDPYNNLWITYGSDLIVRYDGEHFYSYHPLGVYNRVSTIDNRGRYFLGSSNKIAWFWDNSWNTIPNETGLHPWSYGTFFVDPYQGELWYSTQNGELVRYIGEDVPVEESARPVSNILCENHPNPFNPETLISYTLPQAGKVTVTIYNVAGQKITELARGYHSAGKHTVTWNARGCASGVYFCMVRQGKSTEIRKMLLMR